MEIKRDEKLLRPHSYLVLVIGIVLSVLAWYASNYAEIVAIDKFASAGSTAVRDQLAEHIKDSFGVLERLALRWETGNGIRPDVWKADTEALIRETHGLVAIARFDSSLKLDRISDDETSASRFLIPDAILPQIESVRVEKQPSPTTVWLQEGEQSFLYLVPLYINDEFQGSIAGLFHIAPFVQGIIHEQMAYDFHISIRAGGQEVYAEGTEWTDEFTRIFNFTFANGESWHFKVRLTRNRKSELDSGVPEFFLIVGLILTVLIERSISLRQKAIEGAEVARRSEEEALEAQHLSEYYRSLVEHSIDAIMTKDVNSIITSWNHSAELLFGYSSEEAVGQHVSIIFPEEVLDEEQFFIEQIKAGEKIEAYETIRMSKLKEIIEVSLTVSPVKASDGSIIGASVISRDIREKNLADRRFRRVITSALDAVILMDGSGLILDWNPQAEKTFGWKKEEITGKKLADCIIPERYREAHWNGLERFLTTGEGPILNRRIEISAIVKSGEEIPVELSVTPHSHGGKYEFSAFLRDLSKEKKTLSELQFRTEEMEQLLYSVSHDLKSPLVTIQGFSEMLASMIASGRVQEAGDAATRITRATRTMGNLINDLLQLGRVGKGSLIIENTNVEDIVKEVIESNAVDIQKGSIDLVIAEPLPSINTDRHRLYQVFQNLITNAVKYGCSEKGCKIEIGYRETRNDHRFYIKDFGQGIAEEYHRKIFQVFQRLHKGGEGTGLGLAIVAKTMHLLGGQVWVESKPGNGATFWFTLPRYHRYVSEGTSGNVELNSGRFGN